MRQSFQTAKCLILCQIGILLCGLAPGCKRGEEPPYSPQRALETFKLAKGFTIELFAAEPLVADPLAMEIDEEGRVYVVEMPGYPLEVSHSGRVMVLVDDDNDGYPDRSEVFAEGLVLPNGVMRWKKGILVTDAPDIIYFEDTDGDGRADVREVVLTGFAFSNPQHKVNTPLYGLDNWIYLANEPAGNPVIYKDEFGDKGSTVHFPKQPTVALGINAGGRNVRFQPDTFELEMLSGRSQFGHSFDEWGHHFVSSSGSCGRHEVIGAKYLDRNPDLMVPSPIEDVSDHGQPAKVYPITIRPEHQMLTGAGRMTSGSGLTVYLGGLFSFEESTVSFVAEPAHNVVHRDIWLDHGVTFRTSRIDEESEFLASTDSWFRPVNFYVGPDGALYVIDYYRKVIEHPEWMSEEATQAGDLYEGRGMGRIYRIVPTSGAELKPIGRLNLSSASEERLVAALDHSNLWWRRTAQRLLVDRKSEKAVQPLINLFKTTKSAVTRVHTLWTLEGLGELDSELIQLALADVNAGVRENAIRLAESRLASDASLAEKLLSMTNDHDPKVRFQLLCSIGELDSPKARSVRQEMLFDNIEEEWMQIAGLSSPPAEAAVLFSTALHRLVEEETESQQEFFRYLGSLLASERSARGIREIVQMTATQLNRRAEWRAASVLEGLASGVRANKETPLDIDIGQNTLLTLFQNGSSEVRKACLQLLVIAGIPPDLDTGQATSHALSVIQNETAAADLRSDAISLLSVIDPAEYIDLFKRLVDPRQSEEIQLSAVQALGKVESTEVGTFLIDKYRILAPGVRREAVDVLLQNEDSVELFLEAMEVGEVQPWTIAFGHRVRLTMHRNPEIRRRARLLLEERIEERRDVLKQYEVALEMTGDFSRGKGLFDQICAKCHRIDGIGTNELGPDLASVRNRSNEELLIDILIPSRSIADNYETWVIERSSGGLYEGVIASQTSHSIILRYENGRGGVSEEIVPRSDIRRMYSVNLSAMPANLELEITPENMADLLAFLKRGSVGTN